MEPQQRDIVLPPGEFAYVLDNTKGVVNVLVGPHKTTTSANDQLVVWDGRDGRYKPVSNADSARSKFVSVPEGDYVVLDNPAPDNEHPPLGNITAGNPKLQFGRRLNIPGPQHFALWPQQTAKIVKGHVLRSNQYLLVRVVNEEEAKKNWTKGVMKPVTPAATNPDPNAQTGGEQNPTGDSGADKPAAQPPSSVQQTSPGFDTNKLVTGALFIIKGTDVSFYIPPTGIEVVPDTENGDRLIREALTLERLEFCILLGENGDKEYRRGPDVVFPSPTQTFIHNESGANKFQAIELNKISGIHIKVIADYEEGGRQYKTGEELFITGKEQAIYFPRAEHSIIKYGETTKSFAIAVPSGEGRYVLDRDTGNVKMVKGPIMLLPDPRHEVIVRRILTPQQSELWFPGNQTALAYNKKLAAERDAKGSSENYLETERMMSRGVNMTRSMRLADSYESAAPVAAVAAAKFGDEVQRGTAYTPPRTITLDNKYEGAVSIDVWTGYAVMVTKRTGERRVVVGPKTVQLEYDETLMVMELSTGKPKTTDQLYKTVFLRVANNKVSDIFPVETADMVPVEIKVSFVVNFTGDSNKWFDVENYVKLLCDHVRSMMKATAKKYPIAEFYAKSTEIIRDTILGTKTAEDGKRPGRKFTENNMIIEDVEVLSVAIKEPRISELLAQATTAQIRQGIEGRQAADNLEHTRRTEALKQEEILVREKTAIASATAMVAQAKRETEVTNEQHALEEQRQKNEAALAAARRLDALADETQRLDIEKADQALRLSEINAEAEAIVKKAGALGPHLAKALEMVTERHALAQIAGAMSPIAILKGTSVMDVLKSLTKGTSLENTMGGLISAKTPSEVRG